MASLRIHILFFFCVLFHVVVATARTPLFRFRNYSVNDGLSENTVYCISQDHKGFMWFGTKDGLNRFDGVEYTIYRKGRDSVSAPGNNFIRCMEHHGIDTLWVGTDAGVYVMNTATGSFTRFDLMSKTGEPIDCNVNALCFDKMDRLWLSTNKGVFLYELTSDRLCQFGREELPSVVSWSVYEDRSGTIWIGTRGGLLKYDEVTESFVRQGADSSNEIGQDEAFSILEDKDGQLWIGTWSGGLKMLDRINNRFISFYGPESPVFISHIRALMEYSEDRLLIGSDDGLYLFNRKTAALERMDRPGGLQGLSDQNVYSIFRDKEGGVWIGTYFGGVNYLISENNAFENYSRDLAHRSLTGNAVRQFCEDEEGNLWIATEDGGLNYFNTRTRNFENDRLPAEISYHNIHSLLLNNQELWIGTFSRGIDVYDRHTRQMKHFQHDDTDSTTVNDNCIFALYRSSDSRIWVGTPKGLNLFDPRRSLFHRVSEVTSFVYDIREDDYGNLWVASYGDGIFRYDESERKWYNYSAGDDSGLNFNKLISIYIDNRRRLWFSSEGGGIIRYNYRTDNFTTFDENDGLPNNVTYAILDDSYGHLWISSNKGLTCFDPERGKVLDHYTRADGLQSNEFNYKAGYKSRDGMLYFGGINGFNAFYVDRLSANNYVSPVEFTSFHLLNDHDGLQTKVNQDFATTRTIVLPYDNSSFTISFVSLSYRASSKNEYAYKMEGLNDDWNYIGTRNRVTYVDLTPGNYRFYVRGSNDRGVWNETGNYLSIVVRPPWWGTVFAKIIYFLLSLGIMVAVSQYYVIRNKRRNMLNMMRYKMAQEQENLNSKLEFFTSVAHEIRTPLCLIQAPLEEIMQSGSWSGRLQENFQTINRNAKRLGELVNQLLDLRKLEVDKYHLHVTSFSLQSFLTPMLEDFGKTAEDRGITLNLHLSETGDLEIVSDRDALTKVISNLMSNALKFTRDRIDVTFTNPGTGKFHLMIGDNGPGIPMPSRDKIFEPFFQLENDMKQGTGVGLSLARLMARNLGGDIEVWENPGGGSIFDFSFCSCTERLTWEGPDAEERSDDVQDQESHSLVSVPDDSLEFRGQPILLFVDDNDELCRFIEGNFRDSYRILVAQNGKQALEILSEHHVDLIVSDIMMPGIDGFSLVQHVKQDERYCHIPIILLSAKSTVDSKVEGLDLGAEAFVEKPFSPTYLKAQIDAILNSRQRFFALFSKTPVSMYESLVPNRKDVDFINKLNAEIEKHLSDPGFMVEQMAKQVNMSRSNLQRKLNGVCGMSPNDYLRTYRLKRAAELLASKQYRINEVCYLVGFGSPSYFTKCFVRQFGVLPKDF